MEVKRRVDLGQEEVRHEHSEQAMESQLNCDARTTPAPS